MSRETARFEIHEAFQAPARRGYSHSLLTADEWNALAANTGVVRVDIDTAETQPKTHACFPTWRYGAGELHMADWRIISSTTEQDEINTATEALTTELDELRQKQTTSADDVARIWELEDQLNRLNTHAFWFEQDNAFGNGGKALYRACSAPNVSYKIRSNLYYDSDRPFTFYLYRCKPHEAQQECYVRLRFGRYMLEFRQDSDVLLYRYKDGKYWEDDPNSDDPNRGRWVTYNGRDWDRIAIQEQAIDNLLDNGRLTAADRQQLTQWKVSIKQIKATAKSARRDLTSDEHLQISEYEQNIYNLRQAKRGLGQAEKLQLKQMQDALYEDIETVQWQEAAESTFNRNLAFTVIPQRRGFIVIHNSIGRNYWIYEDKRVTENDEEQELIGYTQMQVEGNGGAIWFEIAPIIPEPHTYIQSKPVPVGHDVTGQVTYAFSATEMPGATVTADVIAMDYGYYWQINFDTTDGYLPFIYSLVIDIVGQPRNRDLETLLYSSDDNPDVSWEVGREYNKDLRGRAITLTLTYDRATYADLEFLTYKQIRCYEGENNWFTGILQEPTISEIGQDTVKVTYRAYDRWHILRTDKIWAEVVGDDKSLGLYLYEVMRGVGFADDELDICDEAYAITLPVSRPGELPAIRPEWGMERGRYIETLLDDFGYFLVAWFDGQGVWHVALEGSVTKDITFGRSTTAGHRIMREVTTEEDWSDFTNDISVIGVVRDGKALGARWQDWWSVNDSTASNYIGRWIVAEPHQNEMLRTQEQVNAACRWRAYKATRQKVFLSFTTTHDETLEIGDRVNYIGIDAVTRVMEIIEVRADNRLSGMMQVRGEIL